MVVSVVQVHQQAKGGQAYLAKVLCFAVGWTTNINAASGREEDGVGETERSDADAGLCKLGMGKRDSMIKVLSVLMMDSTCKWNMNMWRSMWRGSWLQSGFQLRSTYFWILLLCILPVLVKHKEASIAVMLDELIWFCNEFGCIYPCRKVVVGCDGASYWTWVTLGEGQVGALAKRTCPAVNNHNEVKSQVVWHVTVMAGPDHKHWRY